ncbi:hypothetical protein CIB84_011798 [Bambusicola thoracicus]|uniref:Uncharacterized protein n=1 Tax=Bambusicola thoracicus TaxID=9083 RepID=A0A2P4SK28_BAMTH|nr:hypothetical protein CIB84_011798 [Bambusicola thoracicus]
MMKWFCSALQLFTRSNRNCVLLQKDLATGFAFWNPHQILRYC